MSTADTSYKTTGGRLTKFASIPNPPDDASPEIKKFMAAVKETVEVREGKRGSELDRSIVVRDLFDPDFTDKYWPDGSSSDNQNISPGTNIVDKTPPASVSNFQIDAGGTESNVLTWVNPTDADLAKIEIYGLHIEGIAPWVVSARYLIDDLTRYGGFVYKCISIADGDGDDRLQGIPPSGHASSATCWMRLGYPYVLVAAAGPKAFIAAPGITWTHELVSEEDKTHDWYYWARAVDESGNESGWNPKDTEGLFALAKTNTGITPDPENLCICDTGPQTVNPAEFNALDLNLCWSPSTKANVADYRLRIFDSTDLVTPRRVVDLTRGCRYVYSYGENTEDGAGVPNDELTIRLWAVDIYGVESSGYDELSVINPPPAMAVITATGIMQGVRFEWPHSTAPDFSHYNYRLRVEAEEWSEWKETGVSIVDRFLTLEENVSYSGEAFIFIQVIVVDTWGKESAIAQAQAISESFIVKPHNIDDFAVNASKIWINLPVLEGDVWYAHSPSSTAIKWDTHNLYMNGVKYAIAAGSTTKKYVYWLKGATAYASSDNNPAGGEKEGITYPDLLSGGEDGIGYVIAVNTNGVYDLAWNAIANQIIGSAYIEDASIVTANIGDLQVNNAKVYGDLDAVKIISGSLESQNWKLNTPAIAGSKFNLNDGTFKLGGEVSPALKWNGSQLTLKGTIMQSPAGTEFPVPVYRGAWTSFSVGTNFYKGDLLTYGGSSWVCILNHRKTSSNFPDIVAPGSSYWSIWAASGEKGDKGNPGDQGTAGPGVTYRGEWAALTSYIGTTLVRDVVKYSANYYICQESHTSTYSFDPSKWSSFGATFSSVATDILLANDAVILRTLTFGNAESNIGAIRSYGKDSYSNYSEAGFFIGWDNGLPKVNIGGPDASQVDGYAGMTWDGVKTFQIHGEIVATGNIQGNAVSSLEYGENPGLTLGLADLNIWRDVADIGDSVTVDILGSGVLIDCFYYVSTPGSEAYPVFFKTVDIPSSSGSYLYSLQAKKEGGANWVKISVRIVRSGASYSVIKTREATLVGDTTSNVLISSVFISALSLKR